MKKLPKSYRNMSKKELRQALLKEMQCNIQIVGDNRTIVKHNDRLEIQLQSAEYAIMSQERVIEKLEFEVAKSKFQTNLSYIIESLENEGNTEQSKPQKFSTDSIQNAIDSFEKIRGESQ